MRPTFCSSPRVQLVPIVDGARCVVMDDALEDPHSVVEWAAQQQFLPPSFPYPGLVCDVPAALTQSLSDMFLLHVRKHLGVRRVLDLTVRLSLATTPPQALAPVQWMCHRDRLSQRDSGMVFAACVLYLFHNPAFGGTSFYKPRQSAADTELLVADSQTLDAHDFGARYGLEASYMHGSNAYFEQVAQVGAAWNRLIAYDGSLFHTADVGAMQAMSSDPRQGRLTLNAFVTCRQSLG